jgi:hypothetical protein
MYFVFFCNDLQQIFRVAQLPLLLQKQMLLNVKVLIMQEHHVLPNLQGKNQSFQIQFFNQ